MNGDELGIGWLSSVAIILVMYILGAILLGLAAVAVAWLAGWI